MLVRSIGAILVVIFGAVCWGKSPNIGPEAERANDLGIIVGPATTIFSGPILPDGTVDYAAAINEVEGKGVTPENNAIALLVRIDDADLVNFPDSQRQEVERRPKLLRLLGLDDKTGFDATWHHPNEFEKSVPADAAGGQEDVNQFDAAREGPWSAQQFPEVAAWLKADEPALAIVEQASHRERCWLPLVLPANGTGGLIDAMGVTAQSSVWSELGRALISRSMLKLHGGDVNGAAADLLTLQRLGNLFSQDPGIVQSLYGGGCEAAAVESFERVLQERKIAADQIRKWAAEFLETPPIVQPPSKQEQFARYEFLSNVQVLAKVRMDEMLKQKSPEEVKKEQSQLAAMGLPMLDWNRVMRLGNKFYDDLMEDDSGLSLEERAEKSKALNDRYKRLQDIFEANDPHGAGNPPKWLLPQGGETRDVYSDRVGSIILMMTIPSFGRFQQSIRLTNERREWTLKVGVALAIYRNERGAYPDNLDALIPKYLDKLPADTSGYPIGYERIGEGYIIRNIQKYDEYMARRLAGDGERYDPGDIIVQAGEHSNEVGK